MSLCKYLSWDRVYLYGRILDNMNEAQWITASKSIVTSLN